MKSTLNSNCSQDLNSIAAGKESVRALRTVLLTGQLSVFFSGLAMVLFAPELINVDLGIGLIGAALLFSLGQLSVGYKPLFSFIAIQVALYAMVLVWMFSPITESLIAPGLMITFLSPITAIYLNYKRASFMFAWVNLLPFLYMVSILLHGYAAEPTHVIQQITGLFGMFIVLNVLCPWGIYSLRIKNQKARFEIDALNSQLNDLDALYQGVFENTGNALFLTDLNGLVIQINRSARALLKLGDEVEEIHLDLFAWLNQQKRSGEQYVRAAEYIGQSIIHFRDDRAVLMESVTKVSPGKLLVVMRDVTNLFTIQHSNALAQERIDFLSRHDNLTALANREGLRCHLEYLISTASQTRDHVKALVAIRLNSVRHANQQYGTQYGDRLIQRFSEELKMIVPTDSFCGRMRSIVFGFTLENCPSSQEVISTVDSLRRQLPTELNINGQTIHVQFSVGLSLIKSDDHDCDDIIRRCEVALDKARQSANSNLAIFDEIDAQAIRRTIDIEVGIVQGLKLNEFYLMYQPKINSDKSIAGFEALLRWESAVLGEISPSEFIPIAERAGSISLLSNFVIESTCAQIREWMDKFGSCLPIAINLSASDMIREDITTKIEDCCRNFRIEPSLLEIEITETGLIANESLAIHHLEKFKLRGVGIAIDDFGTGYSSLSKLSQFPAHAVKIDRSFVAQIGHNSKSELIIKAIVSLANVLGCRTVAEGVENETQELFLRAIGCELFQGYLYHRPLHTSQAEQLFFGESHRSTHPARSIEKRSAVLIS